MEVIVRTQDITRKVILLGDVCVDYHRTDFPWASEEVVIPPFPLVGDLVSLNDGAIVNVLTVLETEKMVEVDHFTQVFRNYYSRSGNIENFSWDRLANLIAEQFFDDYFNI